MEAVSFLAYLVLMGCLFALVLDWGFAGASRAAGHPPEQPRYRVHALRIGLAAAVMVLSAPVMAAESAASSPAVGAALSEGFIKYLLPILFSGVATVLTVALGMLASWLKAKAAEAQLSTQAQASYLFGSNVSATLRAVVAYVETRLRPTIAREAEDGRLTKEEQAEIRAEALRIAKAWLGAEAPARAEELLGIARPVFDAWLAGLLEHHAARLPASISQPSAAASIPGGSVPLAAVQAQPAGPQ